MSVTGKVMQQTEQTVPSVIVRVAGARWQAGLALAITNLFYIRSLRSTHQHQSHAPMNKTGSLRGADCFH